MKHRLLKKYLLPILFAMALAVPAVPLVLTSCSTSQQRITYNTLASVGMTVNSTYSGYLDGVVQGKVGTNDVPRVSVLYNQFQAAYAVAISAAQFNPTNIAPQNVVDLATQIVNLIATIKK